MRRSRQAWRTPGTTQRSCCKENWAELLRQCLARLSPHDGEVIDLVYFHSKSVKEGSKIVGIAEDTAKTRMFHARKKLADLVAAA
jgi:RNA polymerase sigma-70 factor, ECF subfamily